MESLPQSTRDSICKMNTLKVKSKLVKGGMKEEEVEKLDRATALEKLAAQFLAGKHNPKAEVVKGAAVSATAVPYNVTFEREKLEFKNRK